MIRPALISLALGAALVAAASAKPVTTLPVCTGWPDRMDPPLPRPERDR